MKLEIEKTQLLEQGVMSSNNLPYFQIKKVNLAKIWSSTRNNAWNNGLGLLMTSWCLICLILGYGLGSMDGSTYGQTMMVVKSLLRLKKRKEDEKKSILKQLEELQGENVDLWKCQKSSPGSKETK